MTKESTKKFFTQYKEAVESSDKSQKDILTKYNEIRERDQQYCYKPYRTLRNYLQWAKHN